MWRSECVWILGASIGSFHRPSEQTSIVWQFPLQRPSVSIGEIGLKQPDIEKIFIQGGYSKVQNELDGVKKFCSIECEDKVHCADRIYYAWRKSDLKHSATPIYEMDESVLVHKRGRLKPWRRRVRVKFGDLTENEKKEFLFSRVKERLTTIQKWKGVTYERRDVIYNAAALNPKFDECLNLWKSKGLVTNHRCDKDKILQAIDVGHLSLTGPNSCLSTDDGSFLNVDAGQGIELDVIRSHTRFLGSFSSYVLLSMRGNVYKMSFEKEEGFREYLTSRVTHANSFMKNVGYRRVNNAYNFKSHVMGEDKPNAKYVIAGRHHDNDSCI